MTLENRSAMERALGVLEGISYTVTGNAGGAILRAIDLIEGVLETEVETAPNKTTSGDGALVPPVAVGGQCSIR